MSDLKTENIFLVSPSRIININTSKGKQIITFEKDTDNIAATYLHGITYENIFANNSYKSTLENDLVNGDLYVNVHKNDIIRFREYLWSSDICGIPLTYDIDEHILKLKPFYSIPEIKSALEQYKNEIMNMIMNYEIKKVETFKYKRKLV
jgi:hypothetical protein